MQLHAPVAPVVADTELEGVEELALQRDGKLGEPETELRDRFQE
ncbi:hypothetical protein [Streptomyces lycii]|nr:hypothetical protein [Streptomyces lycii]